MKKVMSLRVSEGDHGRWVAAASAAGSSLSSFVVDCVNEMISGAEMTWEYKESDYKSKPVLKLKSQPFPARVIPVNRPVKSPEDPGVVVTNDQGVSTVYRSALKRQPSKPGPLSRSADMVDELQGRLAKGSYGQARGKRKK